MIQKAFPRVDSQSGLPVCVYQLHFDFGTPRSAPPSHPPPSRPPPSHPPLFFSVVFGAGIRIMSFPTGLVYSVNTPPTHTHPPRLKQKLFCKLLPQYRLQRATSWQHNYAQIKQREIKFWFVAVFLNITHRLCRLRISVTAPKQQWLDFILTVIPYHVAWLHDWVIGTETECVKEGPDHAHRCPQVSTSNLHSHLYTNFFGCLSS